MNATLSIDAIVRQTVVLIATLATGAGQRTSLSRMLLVAIHRQGPIGAQGLADLLRLDDRGALDAALETLCAEGLVAERAGESAALFSCERCVSPFGDDQGWPRIVPA